jgi:NAD(P)-dependent dehydrogenase (short-subunit alcohol dehydrogenase family)
MQMFDFKGLTYGVTGGASGIGLAVSEALAAHGAAVAIIDLPTSKGAEIAERLTAQGAKAAFFPGDVSDLASLDAMAQAIETQLGPIGGLVANAGIARTSPALDYSPETWRQTMSINLDGKFFSVQAFARRMAARGGSIVLTSSIAGLGVVSPETHAAYGASKAAVAHLASLLGVEWARLGIRVNAVAPGYTETPILEKMKTDDPTTLAVWVGQTPLGRLIKPQEIANAVLFLLSDLASGITGTVLSVDGGYHQ